MHTRPWAKFSHLHTLEGTAGPLPGKYLVYFIRYHEVGSVQRRCLALGCCLVNAQTYLSTSVPSQREFLGGIDRCLPWSEASQATAGQLKAPESIPPRLKPEVKSRVQPSLLTAPAPGGIGKQSWHIRLKSGYQPRFPRYLDTYMVLYKDMTGAMPLHGPRNMVQGPRLFQVVVPSWAHVPPVLTTYTRRLCAH